MSNVITSKDFRDWREYKFLFEMRNDHLIETGIELRKDYRKVVSVLAKREKVIKNKEARIARHNNRVLVLQKGAFNYKIAERTNRLQDIARSFMSAISFGEMSYKMIKYAVFLKFYAFKKKVVSNKLLLHASIMDDKNRRRFRDNISRMKREEYLAVSHKSKNRCFYYLTHKGKEECELFIAKLKENKLI
jgi:hypothetical protein